MTNPTLSVVILFVADIEVSQTFWRDRLGRAPVQTSPSFVAFAAGEGVMLGLWRRDLAHPPVVGDGGASEVTLTISDVDGLYADWRDLGVPMLAAPADLPFGRTFVATDPDGHRLRVLRPAAR